MNNPYEAPSANLRSESDLSQYQYVGFWVRTVAYIIDGIIVGLVSVPLLWLVLGDMGSAAGGDPLTMPASYWIISIGLPILYTLFFWFTKKTTPGKMLFSSEIVDANTGGQPSKGQFIIRYLGYIVSSLPFGLGFFWVGWDKRKQAWHDKMAGTVVIKPTADPAKRVSFNQP
ncbi:MAG: RDD family protein [Proteobacteria bacterium]|nr:MAG: RDD family protein [Pseudomonadota bacterium]